MYSKRIYYNRNNIFYNINSKYKYILTVEDHFSKLAESYLLSDKKQKTILNSIKLFFEFFGEPEEFGSDNGREFINPSVINYLNEKNIKMINGLPYNPRSQGAVERIHNTIRNGLLTIFLENTNEFNLEKDLIKYMNIYNKSVHQTTKFSPYEVFYKNDENFYKYIHDKILDKYNKNIIKDSIFIKNEHCLLINNFMKSKEKCKQGYIILLKNKVKKKKNSFIKICAEIIEYINGGNYLIKIKGFYIIIIYMKMKYIALIIN